MDMTFWREPIYDGATQTIYVLWRRQRSQVREFVDDLNDAERKKLIRAFRRIGDHGPPQSQEKWRQIKHRGGGGTPLYEIKSSQVRVLAFRDDDNALVLATAFLKKRVSQQQAEIERAARLVQDYLAERET